MSNVQRKRLRLIDLLGTAVNLIGLALGLAFMYWNWPGLAFGAIALSIIIYALARLYVGIRVYRLPDGDLGIPNGINHGVDNGISGSPGGLRLSDYRAEIVFSEKGEQ